MGPWKQTERLSGIFPAVLHNRVRLFFFFPALTSLCVITFRWQFHDTVIIFNFIDRRRDAVFAKIYGISSSRYHNSSYGIHLEGNDHHFPIRFDRFITARRGRGHRWFPWAHIVGDALIYTNKWQSVTSKVSTQFVCFFCFCFYLCGTKTVASSIVHNSSTRRDQTN